MYQVIKGNYKQIENDKIAIIVSRFNEFISKRLLEGAIGQLNRHNCQAENIDVIWVPGAFEIPITASKIASTNNYTAIICLGTIIRGDTPHFDYVASEAVKGIAKVGLDYKIPTIFGVITAENLEQAIERAGTKAGNKGIDAANTAIEMLNLFKLIK